MNKQESAVILDMVSYRHIECLEEASRFLGILEHAGGIYVPEVIGDKERYKPGDTRQVERYVRSTVRLPSSILQEIDRKC